MPPRQKSGAEKRKQKKRENQLIEKQRGSLNMFFPVVTSVDNQRQESEPGQDDDHNSNVDHEVNEQSSGQGK